MLAVSACGAGASTSASNDATPTTPPPAAVASSTSITSSTTTTSTQPPTTTTTPEPTTTSTAPTTTVEPPPALDLPATNAAFDALAGINAAVSLSIVRDGVFVASRATGSTIEGDPAHTNSAMVVASVSKLVTSVAIARLAETGRVALQSPMPWADLGITPDPGWNDVTVRELLDHTGGMPVERESWFTGEGDCASFLPSLLERPPEGHRGRWTYSNGNYCALGLLVSAVTDQPLHVAVQQLLFDPLGRSGIHLTTDGQRPTDIAYSLGVDRLSRLGGAGTFIVSTDDLAMMLATTTDADRTTLAHPAVLTDQYGWGHTGTVDSAKSCAWTLESGRTIIVVTVAGNGPWTGGEVCDRFVPAVAKDLDLGVSGEPQRSPR